MFTVRLEKINSTKARELLATSIGNRSDTKRSEGYAAVMIAGGWDAVDTGQDIVITDGGGLQNGHGRLKALVLCSEQGHEFEFTFKVQRGATLAQVQLHQGKAWSGADYLDQSGVPNAKRVAAAVRTAHMAIVGLKTPTPKEQYDLYMAGDQAGYAAAVSVGRTWKRAGLPGAEAVVSGFAYATRNEDDGEAVVVVATAVVPTGVGSAGVGSARVTAGVAAGVAGGLTRAVPARREVLLLGRTLEAAEHGVRDGGTDDDTRDGAEQ